MPAGASTRPANRPRTIRASDVHGVALALGAAVAADLNSVGIVRTVGHINPLVATFHMALTAAVALPALALATGSVQLPVSGTGWAGMFAVIALQCASRALFGELLGAAQLVGGAMVLAGVMLMQWHDGRTRRRWAS